MFTQIFLGWAYGWSWKDLREAGAANSGSCLSFFHSLLQYSFPFFLYVFPFLFFLSSVLSFLLLSFLSVSLSVYLSSFFSCFVPFCSFFPLFLCFVPYFLCMFLSLIVFLWKPCHSLKVVLREIQQAEGKEWCLWDSKKTRRSLYSMQYHPNTCNLQYWMVQGVLSWKIMWVLKILWVLFLSWEW